jgi:hypothetical protein
MINILQCKSRTILGLLIYSLYNNFKTTYGYTKTRHANGSYSNQFIFTKCDLPVKVIIDNDYFFYIVKAHLGVISVSPNEA